MIPLIKLIHSAEIATWKVILSELNLPLDINGHNQIVALTESLSPEQKSHVARLELQESKFFGPFIHVVEILADFCTVEVSAFLEVLKRSDLSMFRTRLDGLEWKSLESFVSHYDINEEIWIQPLHPASYKAESDFLIHHTFQMVHLQVMRTGRLNESDQSRLAQRLVSIFRKQFNQLQNFDVVLYLHQSYEQLNQRKGQMELLINRWRDEIKSLRSETQLPNYQLILSDLNRLTYQWPDFEDYVYSILSDQRGVKNDRELAVRRITSSLVFWKQGLQFQAQILSAAQLFCEEQYEQKV